MSLKLNTPFPIFAPSLFPNPNPRAPSEIRFSRWGNANAERFELRRRTQEELEAEIRRDRRFDAATSIVHTQDSAAAATEPKTSPFRSRGTPSQPSARSIPGRRSKYSKPDYGPTRPKNKPKVPDSPPQLGAKPEVKLSEDGLSYVIDGAPFEFKYSYTETPKVKPLKLREAPYAPFGPTTMGRPWTGRAPLPHLPPAGKKGVKPVQKPGPFRPGVGPRYVYTKEEILGEPLTKEEIRELVTSCLKTTRQLNMGRDGLTHNMLNNIHDLWKRRRVCKIKCKGVCTVDMDNVCEQLEEKIGGKVIYRRGGVIFLFRGRNYNHRTRPRFPLMLWKPAAPVYPRLIQQVPEGLTLKEATAMRRKGRELMPICKLGKNGVYCDLVKNVREAFEVCELVRIDCQGIKGSDFRKIGAKLKDLVPCVLISFENEQILIWRGREWQSSLTVPDKKDDILRDIDVDTVSEEDEASESLNHTQTVNQNSSSGPMEFQHDPDAVESGAALVLDAADLDPDTVFARAVAFSSVATPGPVFQHGLRKQPAVKKEESREFGYKNIEAKTSSAVVPGRKEVAATVERYDKREKEGVELKMEELDEDYREVIPHGTLKVDELAKLLA
ncbi:BnaA07g00670D [Brassica napus]|uniref:BnaA07g00670D protein n=1 Tax=Brassica napus TaxID=3708 RepID=A0A078HBZ8_BRANA|nr:BnaA07g00670D [Brassica napus]